MTNLITNSEKSRGNNAVALLLPFERYVQSITNSSFGFRFQAV